MQYLVVSLCAETQTAMVILTYGHISMRVKTPWCRWKIIIILVYFAWNLDRKYASFKKLYQFYHFHEMFFIYNPKQKRYANLLIHKLPLTFMKSLLANIEWWSIAASTFYWNVVSVCKNVCIFQGLKVGTEFF